MADAHAKRHDYHLVDPSPWPIVGSVAAFLLAVGLISWMHKMFAAAPLLFAAGALGVLYTMIAWWRDVIKEAEYQGDHTRVVQISHRYGMILFIASEVMFFVAWFWAFFAAALFPSAVAVVGVQLPPKGTEVLDLLGLLFTSIQAYEYMHAPFSFSRLNEELPGNVYGSTFFMATGFHGFHVIVGTIFLAVCLARAYKGDFTP